MKKGEFLIPEPMIRRAHAYYMAEPERTLEDVIWQMGGTERGWSYRFKALGLEVKHGGPTRKLTAPADLTDEDVAEAHRLVLEANAGPRRLMRRFGIGSRRAYRLIRSAKSGSTCDHTDRP